MHYPRTLAVTALVSALLLSVPGTATAATIRCYTDSSLSSFARQRVNGVAQDLQGTLRMPEFSDRADSIKKEVDDTSLRTGGKLRDIYVGGATITDKRDMVEEYLLAELGNIENSMRGQLEGKADAILATAVENLDQFAPEKAGYRGSGSASRSISPVTTNASRSGSFKLQQRGFLGLMEDVGRFKYTVTVRNAVSVRDIRFKQGYNLCNTDNPTQTGEYRTKVVIAPRIEVRYQFSRLGSYRDGRYKSFSGSFTILNNDDRIEREVDVQR